MASICVRLYPPCQPSSSTPDLGQRAGLSCGAAKRPLGRKELVPASVSGEALKTPDCNAKRNSLDLNNPTHGLGRFHARGRKGCMFPPPQVLMMLGFAETPSEVHSTQPVEDLFVIVS